MVSQAAGAMQAPILRESLNPKSISLPVVIPVITAQILQLRSVFSVLLSGRGGGSYPSIQAPAPVTVQVADKGL